MATLLWLGGEVRLLADGSSASALPFLSGSPDGPSVVAIMEGEESGGMKAPPPPSDEESGENVLAGDGSTESDTEEIAALRARVERNPQSALAQYRLALALRREGRRPESVGHFEAAARIGPETPDLLLDLGVAYTDVSRFEDAQGAYERMLALSPGNPKAYHNLANLAFRQGEFDRAIGLYSKAVSADPQFLHAYYRLAATLKFTGRHSEAYAAYRKVIDMTPKSFREQKARIDSLYQVGAIYIARRDYVRADVLLQEVLKVAPDHPRAHYARAQALIQLGKMDEAQRELEIHAALLEQNPPPGPVATAPQ
jgi:tetratricopeptide (TPR) repeat protein